MSWEVRSLDELIDEGIIELGRGKVISKRDLEANPGTYPVYSSAKENDGMFGVYGQYMFDEELITWSVDGGGNLFHRPKHKFSVTNVGGTLRILDRSLLDYQYLYHVLTYLHARIPFDWVLKAHPSVIRRLYQEIPLPPLPEQQRIVAKLDAAFAALREVEGHLERNRANARDLFESYLNGVFEGKGNDEDDIRSLGDEVDFQGGSQPPKSEFIYEQREGYVRFLQIRDFKRDDKVTYIPVSKKNRTCEEHDIMLGRYGASVGNVLTGRAGAYNVALIKTIPSKALDRDYFYFYLRSRFFQVPLLGVAARSAQDGFSKEDISGFPLPMPKLEEQKSIAEKLREVQIQANALESTYAQKLEELGELKKSILGAAFRGEL